MESSGEISVGIEKHWKARNPIFGKAFRQQTRPAGTRREGSIPLALNGGATIGALGLRFCSYVPCAAFNVTA